MNETTAAAPSTQAAPSAAPATAKPVGPDFCLIQLTPAGVIEAGLYSLRFSNGRTTYVFQPNEPLKVANYEWQMGLAGHVNAKGEALFEIVPQPRSATQEK